MTSSSLMSALTFGYVKRLITRSVISPFKETGQSLLSRITNSYNIRPLNHEFKFPEALLPNHETRDEAMKFTANYQPYKYGSLDNTNDANSDDDYNTDDFLDIKETTSPNNTVQDVEELLAGLAALAESTEETSLTELETSNYFQ